MSLVSSRVALIHRCTVERDATATTDGWGTPDTPDWQPHITDLRCRAWTRTGVERADATTTAVVEDMRVIVPLGTDVNERDRIAEVTYRGDAVIAGPVGIRAVIARKDHLELVLVQVNG